MPPDSRAGKVIPFIHADAHTDSQKLIEAYFSSSTVGMCILDSDFRYLAINNTLAKMHGVSAAEHLGRTIREILGDFADVVEREVQRAFLTGEPMVNLDVSGVLPARTEIGHWVGNAYSIKDAAGTVQRIGIVLVEVAAHQVRSQRKEIDRLQMLLEVSTILTANWNLQQVFPRISARIRRVLQHEYAGFERHDASTGLLVRQAEDFPLGKGLLSAQAISSNNSPGGLVLRERTPMIFSKSQMYGFESELTKSFLAEGLQSLCCLPILRPNAALGVLVLGSTKVDAFHPEDLTLLNQVAAQFAVALENDRAAAEIEALKQRLSEERKYLDGEIRAEGHFSEIVGDSPALKPVLDQVITVASTDATVLILGETGTGKELIARALHRLSRRKDGPFIKVNCAAIPTGLLESELFGHERGAFTGAISQKVGRMELADGGTLFLDEVGEIPLDLQPKLLRVLQDQEFERLGGNRTIRVNVRLVAATNRDLEQGIAEHEFRSDLFYRLSVFPIRLPALRERIEDMPMLVRYFVQRFAQRMDRHIETVPKETMKALAAWHWPGNVRELENLMERSVILTEGNALHVPLSELRGDRSTPVPTPDHTLDNAERAHIVRILRETGGVLSGPDGAAHRLGLKRTTLQSKMKRLKITRRDYLGS